MGWNKLELRELTKEEQEEYGYESIWDGGMPELDEKVLVTYPIGRGRYAPTDIDTWIEFDNGVGFENTDKDIIYWMGMPEYNGELEE